MGYKKATFIANLCFILLAVAFLIMALNFPNSVVKLTIGPAYFPIALCVLLIIASAVSTVTTLRGEDDRRIEIPALPKVLAVVAAAVVFTLLWKLSGMFYVVSFAVTGFLLWFLNPQPNSLIKVAKALAMSLCMQLVVYVVFQRLMYFRF